MSTRISNGYRLPPGISVTDFARSLEGVFAPARHDAIVAALAKLIVTIDEAGGSEEKILSSLEFATHNKVDMSRIKMMGLSRPSMSIAKDVLFALQDSFGHRFAERIPTLDITLSISFLSDPKDSTDVYALVYTEFEGYVDAWESIEGVTEFFYWDGSDSQLESMTRKEWKARQKKWNSVIGSTPPIFNSVKWELSTMEIALSSFSEDEIAAAIKSEYAQRAESLAWAKKIWGDSPTFGHLFKDDSATGEDDEQ